MHKDPFDRLLVAQARYEGMAILTADRKYDVRTVSLGRVSNSGRCSEFIAKMDQGER